MKKELVIFDLDGTLLNTKLNIMTATNYALNKYNMPSISIDKAIKNTGKGNRNLVKESMSIKNDEKLIDKVLDSFIEYANNHLYDYIEVYDGVFECIKRLKELNIKIAVLSNKHDVLVQKIIKHFFIDSFDYVTGARKSLNLKPHPDLVELILKELNVDKSNVILVGDSLVDYETAVNSNIDKMIVTYGFRSREELEPKVKENLEDNLLSLFKYL